MLKPRLLSALLCSVATSACLAADLYVSPSGNDQNPGTHAAPLATIARAQQLAQPLVGNQPVTVQVADGVYYLPESIVFTPQDGGSAAAPVVYRAEHEGRAVLSGGAKLNLQWQPYRDGIFMAKTDSGLVIDQLFVDGANQRMARYPNYDANQKTAAYQGFAADAFSKQRAATWKDPTGGYIHAMHRARWGGYHYRITGKNDKGEVTYEGGWQNNRQMGMHREFRMVENIFEELDAAGEWFHDSAQQTLYYKPPADVDLDQAAIEIVRLRHLVEFRGSDTAPVSFITLQGFVVRHAARTFMDTKEPLLRSDWAIYRGGAVRLTGSEDVQILDCEFDQVGGNAVFASNYNRRLLVKGCHIHDCGASGVCFVGDPKAVRDPLFEYGQKNDLSKIDRRPGPQTNNYPADSTVEDCLIHGIGRVERQPAGVAIAMAAGITVRDCSIYDCARSGINIGDGTWGGHLIEGCDVFDTVLETHDHGSFNSWGRDRYWRSDHLKASQAAVDADPQLPFLDAVETTVIRNSRWRCDHGWDIDLDDGSSNYDIYNNLMLAGGLKLREGFRRHAWNNITVNNGFHPHVWFNHSGDEVYSNIFMAAHRGARMPSQNAKGKRVDGNLFFVSDARVKDRFAEFNWDVNSIVADPEFIDPAAGDFRVSDDSPARDIGFENFPMDQFGVKKPALRSIALTPKIPPLQGTAAPESSSPPPVEMVTYWLGARLHAIEGDEYSAYGVRKEDGGVALVDVPPKSLAVKLGLRTNDLIQGVHGNSVVDLADWFAALDQAGDQPLQLRVVRDQAAVRVTVQAAPFVIAESADSADTFHKIPVPAASKNVVTAKGTTHNDPLSTLVDGAVAEGYGPVFGNGEYAGSYRIDLGASQPVKAISSWSTNKNGNRGPQRFTLYGSNAATDPGFDVHDASRFTPITTIDTTARKPGRYNATSLRAAEGQTLGSYRWIVWRVAPVTGDGENTAFQELFVD